MTDTMDVKNIDYAELYATKPAPKKPVDVQIRKVDYHTWQQFQGFCRFEGTTATQKLKDLIAQYVNDQGKEGV